MKFIAICLHSHDMRDFHSNLRETPFLNHLRSRSIFIPMGRGQAHHHGDSLIADMTGMWSAKCCNSELTLKGYVAPTKGWLPKTVVELFQENGYDIFTSIGFDPRNRLGTFAVDGGLKNFWLKDEPERLKQFSLPAKMSRKELFAKINQSEKFYAHFFLRETHRPWTQNDELFKLLEKPVPKYMKLFGEPKKKYPKSWPEDARAARRLALEKPDEFAALRRKALAIADRQIAEIFDATKDLKDVFYVVYSNHGEVFDHFRYSQKHALRDYEGGKVVDCTSHGNYPYEVLYANMQMWIIPGEKPRVMQGIGRTIDLPATLLDIAGISDSGMDGESMVTYFSTRIFPDRERFAETYMDDGCISMVREDGCKIISTGILGIETPTSNHGFPDHKLVVFDLKSDPWEYVNLIKTDIGQGVLKWAIKRHKELKNGIS